MVSGIDMIVRGSEGLVAGSTLAFGLPGGIEWVIVGLIALLIFGSRLPHVARSMGDALREFKKGVKEGSDEQPGAGGGGTSSEPQRIEGSPSNASRPTPTGAEPRGEEFRVPYGDPARDPAAEPLRGGPREGGEGGH